MAKTQTLKKPTLTDNLRAHLARWQDGQTLEMRGYWEIHLAEQLVELGYLTTTTKTRQIHTRHFVVTTVAFSRTDKPVPPLRFKPMPPDSIWPWGLREHWHKIAASPIATQKKLLSDMLHARRTGSRADRVAYYNEQDRLSLDFAAPATKSELKGLRDFFSSVLDTKAMGYTTIAVNKKCRDPLQAIKTMVGMLVLPVIENGRVTRFTPLSDDRQMDVIGELVDYETRTSYAERVAAEMSRINLTGA